LFVEGEEKMEVKAGKRGVKGWEKVMVEKRGRKGRVNAGKKGRFKGQEKGEGLRVKERGGIRGLRGRVE
jgi:hypothetical protein